MGQVILSEAPVGQRMMLGDVKLKIVLTSTGCNGCAFEKEEGAICCQLTAFCFAHNRKDKQSVKFIEVK